MWFWVFGWFFFLILVIGNGFVIYFVIMKFCFYIFGNNFIVLLVVVDLMVGIFFNFILVVKVVIFSYLDFECFLKGFVFDKVEDFVWI